MEAPIVTDKKILVAYGTRYGTTGGIAEKMAEMFQEEGISAEVVNLKETKSKNWPHASAYDGVLVGSSIKIGRWVKEAQKFLKANKDAFDSGKPKLGLFVSCMSILESQDKAQTDCIDKIASKLELSPELSAPFGPVIDFTETSTMGKMMQKILKAAMQDMPPEVRQKVDTEGRNDLRDWDQIRQFVKKFAEIV